MFLTRDSTKWRQLTPLFLTHSPSIYLSYNSIRERAMKIGVIEMIDNIDDSEPHCDHFSGLLSPLFWFFSHRFNVLSLLTCVYIITNKCGWDICRCVSAIVLYNLYIFFSFFHSLFNKNKVTADYRSRPHSKMLWFE